MEKLTKSLAVSFNSSGDNTVIPALAGSSIRVWQIWLNNTSGTTATTVTFKTGSTSQSGAAVIPAASTEKFPYTGSPWLQSRPGEDVIINQTQAVQVSGMIYYTEG